MYVCMYLFFYVYVYYFILYRWNDVCVCSVLYMYMYMYIHSRDIGNWYRMYFELICYCDRWDCYYVCFVAFIVHVCVYDVLVWYILDMELLKLIFDRYFFNLSGLFFII